MSLTVEQVQSSWFATLLGNALQETEDLDEAVMCAEIAYLAHPEPSVTPVTPNGQKPQANGKSSDKEILPNPNDAQARSRIEAKFSFDIENRHAQGVLNRALSAAQKMTRGLRAELEAALKTGSPSQAGTAVVKFIGKYRDQLASLLGRAQLASLLAGAREVAASVPVLPRMSGFGAPPPPSLPPGEAQDLLEQLRGQSMMQREETLLTRPVSEQIWLRRAVAHAEATPAPTTLEVKDIEFPVVEEAARDLSRKNILTKERADALEAASKQKAFTVAGVESTETLARIRQAIADNIKEGVGYESFRKKVLADVDEGTMLSDAHLETLFRGAVSAAFSDGQMNVLQEPFVRGGFPYAAYDSISDDRRRHTHGELEHLGIQGTNIYRINDPVFQTFRPPWEYGDRCSWKAMTVKQAANDGIEEAQQWLESGEEPNPPAFVEMPPFQPPPEFQRIPMSIQLAMGPIADYMGGFQEKCFPIPHLRGWRVRGGRGRRRGQSFFTNSTHGSFAYVPTKQVGQKWQGPTGRWFVKLPSGRVAPAKAPGAGEAASPQAGPPKPQPPPLQPGQKPVPQPRTRKPTPKQVAKVQSVDAVHAARQKLQAGQALTADEIAALPEHLAKMTVPELKALHNEVIGSKLTSRTLKQGSIDALMKWANPNAVIGAQEPAAPVEKPVEPPTPQPEETPSPEKPAEVPAPTPVATPVPTEAAKPDVDKQIVDLFQRLDKEAGKHNFVDIVNLRKGMEQVGIKGREAQDKAINDLRRAGVLTMSGREGGHREGKHIVSPEQREASIMEDGSMLGHVSLKEGWQDKLAGMAQKPAVPEKPAEPAKPPESPVTPPAPEASRPPTPEIATPATSQEPQKPRMSPAERDKIINEAAKKGGSAAKLAKAIGLEYHLNQEDWADLKQEALMAMSTALEEGFDPSRNLTLQQYLSAKAGNRLHTVARKLASRQFTQGGRGDVGAEEGSSALDTALGREDPAAQAEAADMQSHILKQIATLPPERANVFKLRYGLGGVEEKSAKEIADELGVSRQTVHNWIAEAIEQLGLKDLLGGSNG